MTLAHVLAFAGPTGTGKTTIAKLLADSIRWKYVSFGTFVAEQARREGLDPRSRTTLQDLGQQLVEQNVAQFVRGILLSTTFSREESVVLDGLRHQEVLTEFRNQTEARWVRLIFLTAKLDVRRARLELRDGDDITLTDSHPVESQLGVLRENANLLIDTSDLSPFQAVQQVKKWLVITGAARSYS